MTRLSDMTPKIKGKIHTVFRIKATHVLSNGNRAGRTEDANRNNKDDDEVVVLVVWT